MIDNAILKNVFAGLIVALVIVQLYRNFGPLRDDRSQMAKENLVSLLVVGMAVFAYWLVAGGIG